MKVKSLKQYCESENSTVKVKSVKQYCESEIGKAVLLFACLIDCYLELLGTRARREDSSSTALHGHSCDCSPV